MVTPLRLTPTLPARIIYAVTVTILILAIVVLFYAPVWWLLPDAPVTRWYVWMLGYVCGVLTCTFIVRRA